MIYKLAAAAVWIFFIYYNKIITRASRVTTHFIRFVKEKYLYKDHKVMNSSMGTAFYDSIHF